MLSALRFSWIVAALVCASVVAGAPSASVRAMPAAPEAAALGSITLYPELTALSGDCGCPNAIAHTPDGDLWLASLSELVGEDPVATSAAVAPGPDPSPNGIFGFASAPDGAIWFAQGQHVYRMTPAGLVTARYATNGTAAALTFGRGGVLWFTLNGTTNPGYMVGRIDAAGKLSVLPVPGEGQLGSIALGPDGALWFVCSSGYLVCRMTTAGKLTTFREPQPFATSVAADPRGPYVWLTAHAETGCACTGYIERLDLKGHFVVYPLGSGNPNGIIAGPDGAMWYADGTRDAIGRVTDNGRIVIYPIKPSPEFPQYTPSSPCCLVAGTHADMWFSAEPFLGRILAP